MIYINWSDIPLLMEISASEVGNYADTMTFFCVCVLLLHHLHHKIYPAISYLSYGIEETPDCDGTCTVL